MLRPSEHRGRESLGGVIIKAKIDRTHPVAFGYSSDELAFYKNNTVWLSPSENAYSTVAKYAEDAHVDGYISKKNRKEYLSKAASILVSSVGSGRVVIFADNPNFRGTSYGMNRFFLNALISWSAYSNAIIYCLSDRNVFASSISLRG